MKQVSAVIFVLLLITLAHAQQTWERTYGGTGIERGYSVQQTKDSGYIVVGYTYSFGAGGSDVYLIKTNSSGDTLWTRTYGGTGDDEGYSVQQTSDGGYIIAGATDSYGVGESDVWIIKTDASGDTLWTRTLGGPYSDAGYSVRQTSDGGYIVTGDYSTFALSEWSNVYLVKLNASGDTLWSRTYGGTYNEFGNSVQQTQDGGYVITGGTTSFGAGGWDLYLIKTNASGDTLWTRTYGGTGVDQGLSVQQTKDGNYIIAGSTYSFGAGNDDVWLIKTNPSGDTLWTRTYGGTGYDYGYSVQQTSDSGYVIAGGTSSFGAGWNDVWLIKTNASGDTLWTRTFGGAGPDNGYFVQQTADGGHIIAGETWSYGDSDQVYLIKTDGNGNVGTEKMQNAKFKMQNARLKITPNPFVGFTRVPGHEGERFSLYDVMGRKVGTYLGDRIGEGLAAGVYFLKHQEMLKQVQHDEIVRVVKVR